MGVQDNPKCIGGWAVSGLMGAVNLLERLDAEHYDWDAEHVADLRGYVSRLCKLADLPDPAQPVVGITTSPDS